MDAGTLDLDPGDVIGFSRVAVDRTVCRYILFADGSSVPELSLPQAFVDESARRLPHLGQEIRASHLPLALLQQLRSLLRRQDANIRNVRSRVDTLVEENASLSGSLLAAGLDDEVDGEHVSIRLLESLATLRQENDTLRAAVEDRPFRDTVDKAAVAALQATVARLVGAVWSLVPMSTELAVHQDPIVRKCYTTNLSVASMVQELCEGALASCDELLPGTAA